jgi:PAS domain S-box-containing protein
MTNLGLDNYSPKNMDSKEGLDALFEFATEGILVANNTGEVLRTNPATERMFGYEKGELLGKKVETLVPTRYAHRHVGHREKYGANPHPRSMGSGMDLNGKRKDNSEFPVEISLSPYSTSEGKFVIAFIVDITVRKKAEESVIRQKEELEKLNLDLEKRVKERTMILEEAIAELNKTKEELNGALKKEKDLNELKSRFVSMASHEFRTPLTTILSSASLIPEYQSTEQQEKRVKHVDRITLAVNNLNDILSDFLSLSKIEEGKVVADIKKINLKNLAEEISSELKGICKEGQEIIHKHNGKEEEELDPKLIKNIVINLLSNAIKFSEENKKIFFTTHVNQKETILEIKDEGMGISKEDQEHLFERFFRGHNATNIQGTGLGLNIVSRYVELMNGHIQLQSELEKGTTFLITFPKVKK